MTLSDDAPLASSFSPGPIDDRARAFVLVKFESRFKRCDESNMNASTLRWCGKLALSTQLPALSRFARFARVAADRRDFLAANYPARRTLPTARDDCAIQSADDLP
jgi:hypothetical protein